MYNIVPKFCLGELQHHFHAKNEFVEPDQSSDFLVNSLEILKVVFKNETGTTPGYQILKFKSCKCREHREGFFRKTTCRIRTYFPFLFFLYGLVILGSKPREMLPNIYFPILIVSADHSKVEKKEC